MGNLICRYSSPSVMMGSNGNIDLVVFALVGSAALASRTQNSGELSVHL
jgi:hypothetical protein